MTLSARRLSWLLVVAVPCLTGCLGDGNSVNGYVGARSLDNDDWEDVDEPTVVGIDGVMALSGEWLGLEGGWLRSEDDTSSSGSFSDLELTLDEFFLGLRFTPWHFLIEPYGSAGVTYLDSSVDATSGGMSANDGDESVAGYARLGAALRLGLFRFGLDGRAVAGSDLDLNGDTDVDYYQLALFAGVSF